LFVKVRDEVQNVYVQFSVKKWAVSSVEDQRKAENTNSIERKTGSGRLQAVRSELICCQEGNPGSSRSLRKITNLAVISLSSAEGSCRGASVFRQCEKFFWVLRLTYIVFCAKFKHIYQVLVLSCEKSASKTLYC